MTDEKTLASGGAGALTYALYAKAKATYEGTGKWDKEKKNMSKEDLVKQALKDGFLTNYDVERLARQHVADNGWGISFAAWYNVSKALTERGLKEFAEQAEVSNVISGALELQGAKDFLAKYSAENVVVTVGGYSEKEGKVNVVLTVKNGDKDPPKEVLSFYTDAVLGENQVYHAEVGDVVNSNQNMEATR